MTTESQKTSLSQKLTKSLLDGGVILALFTAIFFVIGKATLIGVYSHWGKTYQDTQVLQIKI